jgi:hypothetical protein
MEICEECWYYLFFKDLVEFSSEALGPAIFFFWETIAASILFPITGLFQ